MSWKLKRVRQCKACPWKVSTDPHDIPNGYDVDLHKNLACTIAEPGTSAARTSPSRNATGRPAQRSSPEVFPLLKSGGQ